MTVRCPKCGVFVSSLSRHLRRKRCEMQHMRPGIRSEMKADKKKAGRAGLDEILKRQAKEGKK